MTSHIPTLLLREWMQHKRGWLIAAFAPPLLFLAMLPFGEVSGLPTQQTELLALATLMAAATAGFGICLSFGLFQLPGLARRDAQDRSIEFWLSLPGRPSESVAATVLAHAWLAPLGGAVVGALLGLPIAASVLAVKADTGAIASVHWGDVFAAALPLLVRGVTGTVLLLLWLAPAIFTLMAASAWLKRLGVPLVLVGGTVAVSVLNKVYDIGWPLAALRDLRDHIGQALIHDGPGMLRALNADDASLWGWAMHDLGQALAGLASLSFLGWMAVAAAGFALVVLKRSRGG
jgi:ABC-2 type transport system permease protein